VRQALRRGRLGLDAAEGRADFLGLDRADGFALDKQQIVGCAGRKLDLAHGDAGGSPEVQRAAVLDDPAGQFKLAVDGNTGLGLGNAHMVQPAGQERASCWLRV
jgi:hypothetical protein